MRITALRHWIHQHGFGLVLLPWVPTALSSILLKYDILRNGGFQESALGSTTSGLAVAEKMLLFRSDCLFAFVLFPLFLCCVTYFLGPRMRLALSALVAIATGTLLFAEEIVYRATGTFSSVRA